MTFPGWAASAGRVRLEIADLVVEFHGRNGRVRAVDGVSLLAASGEWAGVVGESGSGKSTLAHAALRLLPSTGRVVGGTVRLDGRDLLALPDAEMRKTRGKALSLVPQAAMDALDPLYPIVAQVVEALEAHSELDRSEARDRARALFRVVTLPESVGAAYPHQLSGGMRQRVVIAIAIANAPDVLVLDEPTTALDVITQDAILSHLKRDWSSTSRSVVLITHDIALAAENCDRLVVMYAGRVVEQGPVPLILERPAHPYTIGLFEACTDLASEPAPMVSIQGKVERVVLASGTGCRFAPRCPLRETACDELTPGLRELSTGHIVACHRADVASDPSTRTRLRLAWQVV